MAFVPTLFIPHLSSPPAFRKQPEIILREVCQYTIRNTLFESERIALQRIKPEFQVFPTPWRDAQRTYSRNSIEKNCLVYSEPRKTADRETCINPRAAISEVAARNRLVLRLPPFNAESPAGPSGCLASDPVKAQCQPIQKAERKLQITTLDFVPSWADQMQIDSPIQESPLLGRSRRFVGWDSRGRPIIWRSLAIVVSGRSIVLIGNGMPMPSRP